MTLRTRTLAITAATLAGLVLIVYAIARTILLGSFAEIEARDTERDVQRALGAIQDDITTLDTRVVDWSAWDDTYAFVRNRNPEYIRLNLTPDTLANLRINLFGVFDQNGRPVCVRAFDLRRGAAAPVPAGFWRHLAPGAPLVALREATDRKRGVVLLTDRGPMLVASRPIITSLKRGPVRGCLVMGRYLDSDTVRRLGALTRLDVRVYAAPHSGEGNPAPHSPQSAARGKGIDLLVPDTLHIIGRATLDDVYGRPTLVVETHARRAVYEQGRFALHCFVGALLMAGLAFALVEMRILERLVLARLERLSESVRRVGSEGDLSLRVPREGDDELSQLAGDVNSMLDQIAGRDRILDAVGFAADRLLRSRSYEESVPAVLERLGLAAAMGGVALLERRESADGGESFVLASQWGAPGSPPLCPPVPAEGGPARSAARDPLTDAATPGKPPAAPATGIPRTDTAPLVEIVPADCWNALRSGQVVRFDAPVNAPADAPPDRPPLGSAIAAPVFVSNAWWGVILLGNPQGARDWSAAETGALNAAAGTLGAAIQRQAGEEEHRRLQNQLQHAQKMESLGVLAGGIANDLNNLLMGILGPAELSLMQISPHSPIRDNLTLIETTALRAGELANQMLAYSGKSRFLIQTLDLSGVVEEMASLIHTGISKKATLTLDLGRDLPCVQVDVVQIRQVVLNLITNASDAIGDAPGSIRVITTAADVDSAFLAGASLPGDLPAGRYVILEVSDTGCGMDAETRERIFDPFFTTKFVGRGLGLATVLGIVRGHHGTIMVESQPGHGTTFRVLLPSVDAPADRLAQRGQPSAGRISTGTVLVVDDEETVRAVARTALELGGYSVLTAADGREALSVLRSHADVIGAILLDLSMPHMDGAEALRQMRRVKPDLPVILSSGYGEEHVACRLAGMKTSGFIQKPYRPSTLLAQVRAALRQ